MSDKLTGDDMLNCIKCGETSSQALDVETNKYGLVLSKTYYCHCFDGDCGAEGPRRPTSDESIEAWNKMQAKP